MDLWRRQQGRRATTDAMVKALIKLREVALAEQISRLGAAEVSHQQDG